MPRIEPLAQGGNQSVALRHVGPRAAVWPATPAANRTLLGRTDMVARRLPSAEVPGSPDWVNGTYNLRLGDAGDCIITFPNTIASDGVPWRSRFDPTGHLQFLEAWEGGELSFAGVIDQIPQISDSQVQVHCSDPWWLLKKAYERDWICVQAPRDVIERATQLWVPTIVDGFPAGALNPQWTSTVVTTNGAAGSVTIGPSGGLHMTTTSSNTNPSYSGARVQSATIAVGGTGAWMGTCTMQVQQLANLGGAMTLWIFESNGDQYNLTLDNNNGLQASIYPPTGGFPVGTISLPSAVTYNVRLESDGEWVSGFVNGQLVGHTRRGHGSTTSLQAELEIGASAQNTTSSGTFSGILIEAQQPLLMNGTDKGDYVLPGTASTYPNGGLHARYFNDLDLQSDAHRLLKIHAPSRTQAYAGSGTSEYANQQDATINQQANPTPGAATSNWSAIWFGAIWLPLSKGDFVLQLGASAETALRAWVGKTQFGQQLVDQWAWSGGGFTFHNFTASATGLAGTLPYGGGTVSRDGWYPIIVEYAVDSTARSAPGLYFKTIPGSYTDPGGASIVAGTFADGTVVVPATSLSPLGCVDQRYQGVSHFDLVQQTLQAFGYQASVEPQQLESGQFPGTLAPRIREGHDTDIVLQPDRGPRQDGEGLLTYTSGLDAQDFCSSLQGNGAGFQNGTTGQLQALVYDSATLAGSLFDAQGWQDFSDAGFPSLLQALLNSQLGLRLSPWQLLSADPQGSPRYSYTWPLPGSLAKMRWRPGDGLRIQAREINVWDTSPRQMLVITRNFTPDGRTGTQATFAERPRTQARTLKQMLYSTTRWQRNYQRQLVTITGNFESQSIPARGTVLAWSIVTVGQGDMITRARVRIAQNSAAMPLNILVNGVDQTATLNGPWTAVPVNLEIGAVAAPNANNLMFVSFTNTGATASTVQWQLLVDVLR